MLKLLRQGVIVFSIQDKVSHRIAFAWCLSNKNCLFKFVTAVGHMSLSSLKWDFPSRLLKILGKILNIIKRNFWVWPWF